MKKVNGKIEENLPFLLFMGHAIPKKTRKPDAATPGRRTTPKSAKE